MMFNNSGWSTINNNKMVNFENIKEPIYTYDRMRGIEEYTDYKFTLGQKAEALTNDIKEEINDTINTVSRRVETIVIITTVVGIYILLGGK